MKIKLFSQNNLHFFALALIAVTMSFTACNKDENDTTSIISEEEAVAVLEGALMNSTFGIGSEVADAAYIALQYSEKDGLGGPCGAAFDSTVTRSINETRVIAAYTTTWHWKVNCNNAMVPTSLDFDRTSSGEYETSRMASEDSAISDWTISNLVLGSAWTLNGTYTRNGSQTSLIRNQNSFTSELTMNISSLTVNKSTLRVDSGSATFLLTGNSTGGNSFRFEGTIVFSDNGTATVTINGQTYEIDLN